MSIEIKKSINPVEYVESIIYLEERLLKIKDNNEKELIWLLEHPSIFTAGTSTKKNEIIDKSIKLIKSNRGGKITYHGPGQKVFYFVINLNKRKKDIRLFIKQIEKSIISSLKDFKINCFADPKNIGIWTINNGNTQKIGAIGIRVKNWIAYHGFSLNINVDLDNYKKIIPCGIKDRSVSNLISINNQDYSKLYDKIIKNLVKNLEF